jgi:hypothetical protein
MAVRETAAQRKTRIAMLLADYDARSREARKLDSIVKGLKEQIKEIPEGTYGEWTRSHGTPREIVDQAAIKARFAELGEPLPTKMTEAPILVIPKAGK